MWRFKRKRTDCVTKAQYLCGIDGGHSWRLTGHDEIGWLRKECSSCHLTTRIGSRNVAPELVEDHMLREFLVEDGFLYGATDDELDNILATATHLVAFVKKTREERA